jgi:hypothetical protein
MVEEAGRGSGDMKAIRGVEAKRGMVASAYLHPATQTISVTGHRTAEVHPVADPDAAHALLERMGLSVIGTDALLRLEARGRASDAPRRAASGKRDPDTGNPRPHASGASQEAKFSTVYRW